MFYRKLLHSGLSVALLLGTVTLCKAQFLAAATPTPTAVQDVDNPARQPVQFNAFVQFFAGNSLARVDSSFIVPHGKRLVIETITGEIFVPQGQQIRPTLVTTAAGNFSPNHALVFNSKVTFGFQDIYRATLPVRFYADPGTSILMSIARDSTTGTSGIAEITFSGYLIKLP